MQQQQQTRVSKSSICAYIKLYVVDIGDCVAVCPARVSQ